VDLSLVLFGTNLCTPNLLEWRGFAGPQLAKHLRRRALA
jgi:hypothetical protein